LVGVAVNVNEFPAQEGLVPAVRAMEMEAEAVGLAVTVKFKGVVQIGANVVATCVNTRFIPFGQVVQL
jgi:hypothetical protein